MKLKDLENKKILLVGFGVEGVATADFLKSNLPNLVLGIADQKDGSSYLRAQKNYDLAIKSPGIKASLIKIPYTTATNIFFANVKGKTIGVTGTKGKSTTSTLIYEIFKAARYKARLVGNIGNSMLAGILKSNSKQDIWICELSSFQLGDIRYSPRISVMLNLFPEHMDYHGSIKKYAQAKKKIIAKATKNDFFIFNTNYPELVSLAKKTQAKAIPFVKNLPFDKKKIPLIGAHNIDNIRAAVTVAKLFGVDDKIIEDVVANFKPLAHRLEYVGKFLGIKFYDDAISTTPESTIAAIQSLPKIGTIFLGGQDRGYDFSHLVEVVLEKKIANVVLFPDSGEKILASFKKKSKKLPNILKTKDMKQAVVFAFANTKKGYVCLLSTASPSFSVWRNFVEKGELFQQFVKEYEKR